MDDDRARVPFALVGVLLVLGSATLSVTLQPSRPVAEPSVDVAMERGTAEATTALRASVREASLAAAREPVLTPANTSAGRVLNESTPFRDVLRLRIYLRTRDRLGDIHVQDDDVTVTASVPPTPNTSALRAAKRRVSVEPANRNATAVRVRVENVTVSAQRSGRTVGRSERTATVVVRTPVLAVHESVERYDGRLNNGLRGPGFGRRLTGYTYALTWARGYAQYGGAPVGNVLGNGHLGVLTNAALLEEQQAVFGQRDTAGSQVLRLAAARQAVAETSLPEPYGPDSGGALLDAGTGVPDPEAEFPSVIDSPATGPDDDMTVEIGRTADRALANIVASGALDDALEEAYTAEARVTAAVRSRDGARPGIPGPPAGTDWRVQRCWTETRVTDTERVARRPSVTAPGEWRVLSASAVDVDRRVTRYCEYADHNGTKTTSRSATVENAVDVGVLGRYTHTDVAPDRPFETVGSATDDGPYPGTDPNFAGIQRRARQALVDDAGGPEALAARAVEGELDRSVRRIEGERPDGLEQWVVRDLVATRAALRNVSTSLQRGRVGTLEANGPAALATALDHRRPALVDTPEQYDSVAHRALIAARAAYVDETEALLDAGSEGHERQRSELDEALATVDAGSSALLKRALGNRSVEDTRTGSTVDGGVTVTGVRGSPTYLTTDTVDGRHVDSVPAGTEVSPLAVRNVNVFTSPHGDATDRLLDGVGFEETVSFRAAARTLAAAEAVGDSPIANETRERRLRARQRELDRAVTDRLDVATARYEATLAAADVGASEAERRELVAEALAAWETTGERAVAVTNGSAGAAIAAAAAPGNETERVLLEARLNAAADEAVTGADLDVSEQLVAETSSRVRDVVRDRLEAEAERAVGAAANRTADHIDERLGRSLNRVPAGLPVLPTGTPWWVTTNVWVVDVRGGYDRFAVSAQSGSARRPGAALRYVRDGDTVRLDFDGDGTAERFGRADRVTFETKTAVVIVVPPGPQGVGDKDGQMVERSAGWDVWANTSDAGRVPWERGE